MFKFIKRLFSVIDRGRLGLNKGLSMGLPRFESVVDGVQRSTYTVLAGGTGSGKTTLALYSYVYRPLVDNMASPTPKRVKILYFSLEMSAEILLAKLLSLHLFETYGVELSYKQIISKQDVLSDRDYEMIKESEWWLEAILQHLTIYDKPLNAETFDAILAGYAFENGVWSESENSTTYTAYDPNEIIEVIIDHMGLLRRSNGRSKKEEIDKTSQSAIDYRNKCGYSILGLFQINRGSSSMDRRNGGFQEIQLDDIKDTGGPAEDAELVVAIFNPHREKLGTSRGYNVTIMKDKLRILQVLKNRLGESDKAVGVNFFGSIGLWREMPHKDELIGAGELEYQPYLTLIPGDVVPEQRPHTVSTPGLIYRF